MEPYGTLQLRSPESEYSFSTLALSIVFSDCMLFCSDQE